MSGSIAGEVLNQADGQPLAAAHFQLTGEGVEKEGSSLPDGTFAFPDLAAGSYEMTVSKEGFEDGIYGPLVVIDGVPTQLVIALQPKDL